MVCPCETMFTTPRTNVLCSYIIDFEDWRLIRGTLNWYDTEYNAWQMSEMFKPVSSTYVRKPLSSNAGNIGR